MQTAKKDVGHVKSCELKIWLLFHAACWNFLVPAGAQIQSLIYVCLDALQADISSSACARLNTDTSGAQEREKHKYVFCGCASACCECVISRFQKIKATLAAKAF